MTNMIKFAGVVAVALGLTQSLQATPISGSIGFHGDVTLNTTNSGTATAVVSFINPVTVGGGSGAFSTITSGSTAIFTSGTWNFNTPATSPINNFWMVGGFTFELLSSSITSQGFDASGGYVTVDGTGLVSGNGFSATLMNWHFTTQDPSTIYNNPNSPYNGDTVWTFSSSDAATPDGGVTVILLGIALSGIALLKKKLTA